MTTPSEPGPAEREAVLEKLRRRMARAMRRGSADRYEELRAEHDRLKDEHVAASHREMKAAMRARRAVREAVRVLEGPSRAWRLPRGFSSPLTAERARTGWREPPHPGYGLRPWREVSPGERQIWRP